MFEGMVAVMGGVQPVATRAQGPSFKGLQPAGDAASRAKRSNRKTDTTPEILLRKTLWRLGARYRKNVRELPGTPDIVFSSARVAIFCDGDFWHGRKWDTLQEKLARGTNGPYWLAKIRRNIERDRATEAALTELGWRALRLWETDIKRDPLAAAQVVLSAIGKVMTIRPRDCAEDSTA